MIKVCPWRKQTEVFQFVSQKWQQNINEVCPSCRSKIVADESISLCRCYLFCHERCFVEQFAGNIKERQEIKCIRCEKIIPLAYNYTVQWICVRRPLFIVPVICAVLGLLVMMPLLALGYYRQFLPDYLSYPLFCLLVVAFVYSVVQTSRKKFVRVEDIRCTNTNMATVGDLSKVGLVYKDLEEVEDEVTMNKAAKKSKNKGEKLEQNTMEMESI